ncbi:MAG: adenylate cyclase class IV [Planctomycetota bacterium]|jgi:adenylate cyclase class IV
MKEIEVKAYLRNGDHVMEKLEALGCVLFDPIRQIDTVYTKIPPETV